MAEVFMDAAVRFAILGASQDKRVHRIMRRIALDVAKSSRVSGTKYARSGIAVADTDDTDAGRVLSWVNTEKGGDYGQVLALHVASLVRTNNTAYRALEAGLKKYAASAPSAELVALPEALVSFLPADLAAKLMSIAGGITESWLSLTDEEAAVVALSRPVVESDPQKSIESVIAALQSAARAYDLIEASPTCKAMVAIIATPSVNTILTVGADLQNEVAAVAGTEPGCLDLRVIADAMVAVTCAQTPNARVHMHDMVMRFLGQLASNQAATAKYRFLRALRSAYQGADISRAFLAQNVAVNTKALDVDRIQQVLSKNNLGSLASSFLVKRDLDQAWDTMNLRGYLEMLRWQPFQDKAASMVGGSKTRLLKLLIQAVVRMNERDLKEVIVKNALATDLILHLLELPTGEDYGMSDIRTTKDATVKDLVHRLITCANLARSNDSIVDAMLVEYTNLMASAAITPDQATKLRRICDACYPKGECLDFLRSQLG